MKFRGSFTIVVCFCLVGLAARAHAGTCLNFTIDTTSINGLFGGLDFQLNGGFGSFDAVSATIFNFQSDGTPGLSFTSGDASGDLATQIDLDNGSFFNDFQQNFTFGSTLHFLVTFSGPGLLADSFADSGTSFLVSTLDRIGSQVLTSVGATGIYELDFNPDGSLIATDNSGGLATALITPEPSPAIVFAALAGFLAWRAVFKRRTQFIVVLLAPVSFLPLHAQIRRPGMGYWQANSMPHVSTATAFTGGGPFLTYRGGYLVRNASYLMVYWGPYWTSPTGAAQRAYINSFVQTLAPSTGFAALFTEYAQPGNPILAGSYTGEKLISPGPPGLSLTDGAIQSQISAWITAGILPVPDANTAYVIMVPPAVEVFLGPSFSSCGGFYGYHNSAAAPLGAAGRYRYIVMPYFNCGTAILFNGPLIVDKITELLSHEMAEFQTDPDPVLGVKGWVDASGLEIAIENK